MDDRDHLFDSTNTKSTTYMHEVAGVAGSCR